MSVKLYVGGLPYSTTEEELASHFGQAGSVVQSTIIRDRQMNNRSRGFGFVEMADQAQADQAISMFNGKDFGGRNLIVSIARPLEERS
jgi:cold-inducible RNA-binding protein